MSACNVKKNFDLFLIFLLMKLILSNKKYFIKFFKLIFGNLKFIKLVIIEYEQSSSCLQSFLNINFFQNDFFTFLLVNKCHHKCLIFENYSLALTL